jgi:hypothetical protein
MKQKSYDTVDIKYKNITGNWPFKKNIYVSPEAGCVAAPASAGGAESGRPAVG